MSELIYKKWADNRNETIPVGNGRIGAMIYGNPLNDILSLNEETLWSGAPEGDIEPYNIDVLNESKKLIAENKHDEAEKLLNEKFMRGVRTQTYLPLGSLSFSACHNRFTEVADYIRTLDMTNGIYKSEASMIFKTALNTSTHTEIQKKECFSSLADDVLIYNIKTDMPSGFSVFLNLLLESDVKYENGRIYATGRCPTKFDEYDKENILPTEKDKESIAFSVEIAFITDGYISCQGRSIVLSGMTDTTVIMSVATSFNGYDKMPLSEGKDYTSICKSKLEAALKYSYEELKARHTAIFSEQFSRSEIRIDGKNRDNLPTDERIRKIKNGESDPSFVNILFDFGKYLMISSSQPGGQATNLQGIWNEDLLAPWNCNYTLNINTQMNYWATEAMNLPECHLPLLELTRDLAKRGNHYGMKGWSAAHNTDIWRFNRMATRFAQYGLWDVGGLWLARHLYDHFRYTSDMDFLKENIDILRGVYDFLSDRLSENKDGYLILSPSTSPETTYLINGKKGSVTGEAAMDIQMISDYLEYMIELEAFLGENTDKYSKMKEKLIPMKISEDGDLLEFGENFENRPDPHQHLSHLYGLYPGCSIKKDTPYFNAAKKALDLRCENGGGCNGWANIWTGICYTKFGDGEKANERIKFMITNTIYDNLFNYCPPFQIDGNFGICALIIEMLVQGNSEDYTLLPAIPSEWKSGKIRGIKLPGGKEVSFSWEDNKPYNIKII